MQKHITIKFNFLTSFLGIFFAVFFCFATYEKSFSASVANDFSKKLWQEITKEDEDILNDISLALEKEKYEEALNYAAELKRDKSILLSSSKPDFYEAAVNLILWKKYSDEKNLKNVSFSDISRFVSDNKFYPNYSSLKRNVEKVAVFNNVTYQVNEKYFNLNPAETRESKLYFLESKIEFVKNFSESDFVKNKMKREINDIISQIWTEEDFSLSQEKEFLEKYSNQLTEDDHIKRIDRLLWNGQFEAAKRIMNLVNQDYQRLFLARIKIPQTTKYVEQVVRLVPRRLRLDEGLLYQLALWYRSHDQVDDLIDLMLDLKESKFPEKWWSLRHLYAREMFKKEKFKISYGLVKNHSLSVDSSDFWEAEWTAGWIALRFLDRPKEAYAHFENLYQNVKQPVTLARATYWLAMAAEAKGDKDDAIRWYKAATKYPIFFYGQLAVHKHRNLDPIGAREDIVLPKSPRITSKDMTKISKSIPTQLAFLLSKIGKSQDYTKLFEYSAKNAETGGEIYILMRLIDEIGNDQLSVKISRIAAKKNIFFIKEKFRIVKEIANDENAPLIHAIVKQESGFAASAVSHVGAIGFMQLMPETAKLVAKDLGISYDKNKLSKDIKYNVLLGSTYIKKLIERFDGSEMLAIASYNAGPNAAQRWINEFYDPRKEKDINKIVDWIELITYSETRDYVQRITENLIVYKYIMSRSNYDEIK